jgi:two-component system, LytTR family, sensor kinase
MTQDERLERAKKRVKDLREFYTSLTTYVIVMSFLFFIDYSSGGGWWVYWPAMGWGIGLAFHAFRVFGPSTGSKWEQRKIKEYMERDGDQDE